MSAKFLETIKLRNRRISSAITFALFLVAIFAGPRIWAGDLEAQEEPVTVQAPKLQTCSQQVKSAITTSQDQLAGVIALYKNGTLGTCWADEHEQLKPLSQYSGGKRLDMKKVINVTFMVGSHCICVNGRCFC